MPTGRHLGHRAPSIADKARIARANRTAADLVPVIAELRASGITSLNGIAAAAAGAESTQGKCTIRATMNGDVIRSFDWEGTESQCANYALMLKGSDCRRGMMDARLWVPACP
jgi:hypothetical protein